MPESMKDHQERSILVSFIYYVSVCINVNVCAHMSVHMRRDPKRVLGVFYLSLSLQGLNFLGCAGNWGSPSDHQSLFPSDLGYRYSQNVALVTWALVSALTHRVISPLLWFASHVLLTSINSVLAAMETNRSATPLQLKTPFWELGNPGFKSLLCHKWMVWCLTRSLTHLLQVLISKWKYMYQWHDMVACV